MAKVVSGGRQVSKQAKLAFNEEPCSASNRRCTPPTKAESTADECPLLAQSGHWLVEGQTTASDPKRTFPVSAFWVKSGASIRVSRRYLQP